MRRRAVCVRSPRLHVATQCNTVVATQLRRKACNALQQYDASQCRYIDKLGVGPILPLLHEIDAVASRRALIDAVAELQRLDVPVRMQRTNRCLARAHKLITPPANTRARVFG